MSKTAIHLVAMMLATNPVFHVLSAQDSTKTDTSTTSAPSTLQAAVGVITGRVVDKDGKPLEGVLVSISAKGLEGSLITQGSGRFRFQGLPAGIPFNIGFAKRDFLMETRNNVVLNTAYEAVVNVVLRQTKVKTLKPITVVAAPPKGSRAALKYIGADEISKANVPNILQALQRLRPSMLVKHTSISMCIDSVFSLYVDGIRRPIFEPEYTEFDSTQARMRAVPLSQVVFERELEWIEPKEIAQITYISCDDFVQGIPRRNVIWVVTKRALAGAAAVKELETQLDEEEQAAEQQREAEEEQKKNQ